MYETLPRFNTQYHKTININPKKGKLQKQQLPKSQYKTTIVVYYSLTCFKKILSL